MAEPWAARWQRLSMDLDGTLRERGASTSLAGVARGYRSQHASGAGWVVCGAILAKKPEPGYGANVPRIQSASRHC